MSDDAKFKTEAELAAVVASWGEAMGWDVYKEVSTPDGDCDLVLVQGRVIWIVECKLRLSDELLLQATRRLSYGHHVSVAVPSTKGELGVSKEFYLEEHGIGLLLVDHPDTGMWKVKRITERDGRLAWTHEPSKEPNWQVLVGARIRPSVRRHSSHSFCDRYVYDRRGRQEPNRTVMARRIGDLRAFLSPEHKKLTAGGRGGQLTPWRMAKLRIVRLLEQRPLTTAEIFDGLGNEHPWQSRRAAVGAIGRMLGEICRREFKRVDVDGVCRWALADQA